MFWQKSMETMDREALRALQLKRLQWTVKRCYENVPFYRKRLDLSLIHIWMWRRRCARRISIPWRI